MQFGRAVRNMRTGNARGPASRMRCAKTIRCLATTAATEAPVACSPMSETLAASLAAVIAGRTDSPVKDVRILDILKGLQPSPCMVRHCWRVLSSTPLAITPSCIITPGTPPPPLPEASLSLPLTTRVGLAVRVMKKPALRRSPPLLPLLLLLLILVPPSPGIEFAGGGVRHGSFLSGFLAGRLSEVSTIAFPPPLPPACCSG